MARAFLTPHQVKAPQYSSGKPDFEHELHHFLNGRHFQDKSELLLHGDNQIGWSVAIGMPSENERRRGLSAKEGYKQYQKSA